VGVEVQQVGVDRRARHPPSARFEEAAERPRALGRGALLRNADDQVTGAKQADVAAFHRAALDPAEDRDARCLRRLEHHVHLAAPMRDAWPQPDQAPWGHQAGIAGERKVG
jgi:hypothetical protein